MSPFADHLSHIRESVADAGTVIAIVLPHHQNAREVLKTTWEVLHDRLCDISKTATLDELNTASAIVYKLSQSSNNLTSLEHKTLAFEEQRARLRLSLKNTLQQQPGLSPAVRDEIEREFSLLA